MTIMISGHTVPVRDLDHAARLRAKARRLSLGKREQWLYAGAPIRAKRAAFCPYCPGGHTQANGTPGYSCYDPAGPQPEAI